MNTEDLSDLSRDLSLTADNGQQGDPANVTNPQHVHDHVISPPVQVLIFAALLAITLIITLTSFLPMGILNPIVTIGGAFVKASLVILFYMHVKSQSRLIKATVFSGFFILGVLVVMSGSDYISRAWGMW